MALVLALSPKIQTNYELLSDSEDRQLSRSIEERELAISSMIADGVPKIFFTCYRAPKKSEPKLFVSTNQANWEGMPVDFVKTQETQRAIHETLDTFPECSDEPVRRKHATGTKQS